VYNSVPISKHPFTTSVGRSVDKKVQLLLSKKYDPLKESNFLEQQVVSRQPLNLKKLLQI
jgi:hypothetical protein